MADSLRQYYVAVSGRELKLPTLGDLINALLASGPIGIAISCSSRDTLDAVTGGIASAVPDADFSFLHADLGAEEIQNTLSTLAARLRAGGEEARSSSDGDAPEAEPAVLRDRVREAIEGREPLEAPAPSQSQKGYLSKGEASKGKGGPRAQVVAMTGVIFKMIDGHHFPAELELIINFDLPLHKGLYSRQMELLRSSRKSQDERQKIIIHFVVAGEIASFRSLEAQSPAPIEVMPVHVVDIFEPRES